MRSGELTADTRQLRREERLPGLLCYTARLTGSDSPHQQISPTVGPDSFTSLPVPRPCNSKLMLLDSDRYLPMAFLRNFVFVLIISLLPSADQFVPMDWRADDTTRHGWIFSIFNIPHSMTLQAIEGNDSILLLIISTNNRSSPRLLFFCPISGRVGWRGGPVPAVHSQESQRAREHRAVSPQSVQSSPVWWRPLSRHEA